MDTPDATAAKAAEKTEAPKGSRAKADTVEEIVNTWLGDYAANSPLSQNTAAWNHLLSVLPDLKSAIVKGV